jgi:hypothetical protein
VTRLLLVEARRALARRLVRVLILVALAVTATTGILVFANADGGQARPADRLAEAQAIRRGNIEDCARFEADRATCEQRVPPAAVFVDEGDDRFHLTDLWPTEASPGEEDGVLQGTAVPLIIAALLAGASVVGAEWRAGTMALLLTWEPRRVRVLGAKAVVVFVLAAAIGLALQAVFVAALVPAALRGTTEGADADWWLSLVGGTLRIAGVTGLAALAGASLATLAGNTAGALGVAFGYLAVAENTLRGLRPRWSRWFVSDNIAVVVTGDPDATGNFARSVPGSAALVTLYVGALFLVALATFRTRDVT